MTLGVLQAWVIYKQNKTGNRVEEVHSLVNSAMGLQKRQLAEVTAAKAAITHSPADLKAAEIAMSEYLEHVKGQEKADAL